MNKIYVAWWSGGPDMPRIVAFGTDQAIVMTKAQKWAVDNGFPVHIAEIVTGKIERVGGTDGEEG